MTNYAVRDPARKIVRKTEGTKSLSHYAHCVSDFGYWQLDFFQPFAFVTGKVTVNC